MPALLHDLGKPMGSTKSVTGAALSGGSVNRLKCAVLHRTCQHDRHTGSRQTGVTPQSLHRSARRAGMPPARFSWLLTLIYVNGRLQPLLRGYLLMSKKLLREDVHSEILLALAGCWRSCAAQSNEPWRSDMMRGTAEEFERAAAKTTSQTPATLSP